MTPRSFEGEWAERLGDTTYDYKYILHDGWITNCKMPNPWWRMKGPKFDIIPDPPAAKPGAGKTADAKAGAPAAKTADAKPAAKAVPVKAAAKDNIPALRLSANAY